MHANIAHVPLPELSLIVRAVVTRRHPCTGGGDPGGTCRIADGLFGADTGRGYRAGAPVSTRTSWRNSPVPAS